MRINKTQVYLFNNPEETSTIDNTAATTLKAEMKSFDVVSSYQGDPFVGNLATPVTASNITKTYLSLLPAYKKGLSPLLRGMNIGIVHGYFLLGPFVKLGPLRESPAANFIGFVSTISLIVILTFALLIYGFVTFSETKNSSEKPSLVDFLSSTGWRQFTSGFIIGGFGGSSVGYLILKFTGI